MGNRATPSRSFNTVKHSNRDQRKKRREQERMVLLAIFATVALLLLTLAIFLVCSIVDVINDRTPPQNEGSNNGEQNDPPVGGVTYTQITKASTDVHTGELLVVNDQYAYQFPTTAVNLKVIYDNRLKYEDIYNTYMVGQTSWKLHTTALDAFNQMMYKYYELEEDGSICITSAYRTLQDQEALGSTVRPGYSDHHTGYCVAIKQKTESGNVSLDTSHWIYQNAHKYGFIVRYPEDKSDITGVTDYLHCFRYVGVAHATYIYENGICLEEYAEILKQDYAAGTHLQINAADGNRYEVYYVPAGTDELTTISVPQNYAYTVSGDNIGGFIVTVNLNAPNA